MRSQPWGPVDDGPSPQVLIVGGGTAGLTVASLVLKRRHPSSRLAQLGLVPQSRQADWSCLSWASKRCRSRVCTREQRSFTRSLSAL